MICETIRSLRENAGYSQAELARKLGVTRSSINAWESGLSAHTAVYIVELAKLFHVSTDHILGLENTHQISLTGLTDEEIHIIYSLLKYFDSHKNSK